MPRREPHIQSLSCAQGTTSSVDFGRSGTVRVCINAMYSSQLHIAGLTEIISQHTPAFRNIPNPGRWSQLIQSFTRVLWHLVMTISNYWVPFHSWTLHWVCGSHCLLRASLRPRQAGSHDWRGLAIVIHQRFWVGSLWSRKPALFLSASRLMGWVGVMGLPTASGARSYGSFLNFYFQSKCLPGLCLHFMFLTLNLTACSYN